MTVNLAMSNPTIPSASRKKAKRRNKIFIFGLLGTVAAVAVAMQVFKPKDEGLLVTTEKAALRTITQMVSSVGNIQPERQVKISSETSGEVIELPVKEGDTVRRGQLLARIQPDLVESQLQQARASAEAAKAQIERSQAEVQRSKRELARIEKLAQSDFASKDELDRARATYEQAEAGLKASQKDFDRSKAFLEQAEATASRTVIYSPVDGIITSLSVEKGEKVVGTAQMQGTEMMRISNLNVMNAWVEVDENDVVLLSIGDTALVEVDAFPDKVFEGVVYQVANSPKTAAAGASQSNVVNFEVRIRLFDMDGRLRPGMSCSADIKTETRYKAVSVPLQAVTVRREQQMTADGEEDMTVEAKTTVKEKKSSSIVFVRQNDKALMRKVKTGLSDRGYIEIIEGVKEGEEIVSGDFRMVNTELQDSSKIKVEPTAATPKQ